MGIELRTTVFLRIRVEILHQAWLEIEIRITVFIRVRVRINSFAVNCLWWESNSEPLFFLGLELKLGLGLRLGFGLRLGLGLELWLRLGLGLGLGLRGLELVKTVFGHPNFKQIVFCRIFFFSFRPFPSIKGSHSVLSSSKPSCLQRPSPSYQSRPYPHSPHLKIFSLVSLFSSFPKTPFSSSFFLHTYFWSLLMTCPYHLSLPSLIFIEGGQAEECYCFIGESESESLKFLKLDPRNCRSQNRILNLLTTQSCHRNRLHVEANMYIHLSIITPYIKSTSVSLHAHPS